MKNDILTATVYYDYNNKEHHSRKAAVDSNKKRKEEYIDYQVEQSVVKILETVDSFKFIRRGELTLSHLAKYLMTTSLPKAEKKIKELFIKAEKEFEKYYPDIVLK